MKTTLVCSYVRSKLAYHVCVYKMMFSERNRAYWHTWQKTFFRL